MPSSPKKPGADPRMEARAVFLAGLFELCGLGAFIAGYFMDILWLMVAGGCMLVLDDLRLIRQGTFKLRDCLICAVLTALVFDPWYAGVFWASAIVKIFCLPLSIIKLMRPEWFLETPRKK